MHSIFYIMNSHQNNCSVSVTQWLYNADNVSKFWTATNIKWNNCYNYEKSKHFVKNCRSSLKNFNYIKINVIKTKKEKALLTVLQW